MTNELSQRKAYALLALITLFALFLDCFQLASQPVSQDDFYVAVSSINYMESGQLGPTMWNHPGLRNILVYGALRLFGSGVIGVKGVTLVLGLFCTPLMGLVAQRIFKSWRVGLIAALLWACDALVIDFSRQGINDIYLAFFPLAAIYLAYRFRESGRIGWLVGAGLFFGMGLASKWSGLFPLVVTLALLLADLRREPGPGRAARFCQTLVLMLVLPALVYLLTFLPWFSRGYSLAEWPALQRSMYLETSQHVGYHPKFWDDRDNRAYKWFVVPSVFVDPFMNLGGALEPGRSEPDFEKAAIVELGVANPLVWLLVLPAMFLVLRRAARERDEGARYLAGLFFLSYLPLVASPRPIWLNTALSVLPYAIMAVAYLVWTQSQRLRRGRVLLAAYLSLVLLVAAPLYLLAVGKGTGIPVLKEYLAEKYLKQFKGAPNAGSPPTPQAPGTR